jgi:hypothetical protein
VGILAGVMVSSIRPIDASDVDPNLGASRISVVFAMIMHRPRCYHENGIYDFITKNLEFKRKILPPLLVLVKGKEGKGSRNALVPSWSLCQRHGAKAPYDWM